jgi:segregation and condensation protein A
MVTPFSSPDKDAMKVRCKVFEGPLDLLLHLIRQQQLDIYDIPIVEITEQYLQYLNLMRELDLDIAGDFLVMAATLVQIKSRMLLPQTPAEEGQEEEADPRAELVRRLLEHEQFKKAAEILYEKRSIEGESFARGHDEALGPAEEEKALAEVSIFDLLDALNRVIQEAQKRHLIEISEDVFSIEVQKEYIRSALGSKPHISFAELFSKATSRDEILVTFLAMLELVRLKEIRIYQSKRFGEILLYRIAGEAGQERNDDGK